MAEPFTDEELARAADYWPEYEGDVPRWLATIAALRARLEEAHQRYERDQSVWHEVADGLGRDGHRMQAERDAARRELEAAHQVDRGRGEGTLPAGPDVDAGPPPHRRATTMKTFPCPRCDGTGSDPDTVFTDRSGRTSAHPCPRCTRALMPGVGRIDEVECSQCDETVVADDAADARTCKRCAVEVVR